MTAHLFSALVPYSIYDLIVPSLILFFGGFFLSFVVTRSVILGISVSFVKIMVFVLYYGFFFDGTFTFKDDWTYLSTGAELYYRGIDIFNFWDHLSEVFARAGGTHIGYYLFNLFVIDVWGVNYFAPVAVNILLTFIGGAYLVAASREIIGCSSHLSAGLFVFFVLHPDILAWSTVMNGKDILVATGTTMMMYSVREFGVGRYVNSFAHAMAVIFLMTFIRFYIPIFFVISFAFAFVLSSVLSRGWLFFVFVSIFLGVMSFFIGFNRLVSAVEVLMNGWSNPVLGAVRFILTPIPFNSEKSYRFLDLPQILNWELLPFMIYGFVSLSRKKIISAKFFVSYFVLLLAFYGVYGELQGPRHRVQLDGLIALFQFYGLVAFLRQGLKSKGVLPWHNEVANSSSSPIRP